MLCLLAPPRGAERDRIQWLAPARNTHVWQDGALADRTISLTDGVSRPARPATLAVRAEEIPCDLTGVPQWVAWDWRLRDGDDRPTKVPLDPRTGLRARTNDPRTWGTFEAALARYRAHPDRTAGIGFVLTPPWVGVDLDDCLDATGTPSAMAADIVARMGTYTEVSPSGKGLKLLGRGVDPLPRGRGARDARLGIEIYNRSRFFALTGHRFHGAGVAEVGAAVVYLYHTYLPHKLERQHSPRTAAPARPVDQSDAELIDLMTRRAANAARVRALWEGQVPAGKSQSEADLALLVHLAFYTGRDPERMERLFGQSALGRRGKWTDRPDYRERTIQAAIAMTEAVYTPGGAPGGRGTPQAPRGHDPGAADVDVGSGYVVRFRAAPRATTEVFLFRNGGEADSHRMDVGNGDRREALVGRWAGRHPGLDADRLRRALVARSFRRLDDRPSAQPPSLGDARLGVELTGDEHVDRAAVLPALADDPLLFMRDGVLVRPQVHDRTASDDPASGASRTLTWRRAPGTTAMVPATVAYVRTRVTAACRLTRPGPKASPCPDYLAAGIHAAPAGIREVRGLALGPLLRPDGSLLNTAGYDAASGLYLAAPVPDLDALIPAEVTAESAREAMSRTWDLVLANFPWKGCDEVHKRLQRSRWYCLLFTALLRHFLEQTPLGLICANTAGSGKTYLGRLVGVVAHGVDPILMTWPEGPRPQHRGDEVRKRLASLLQEGATLALIDNLPRGEGFESPELDAFLTSSMFFDRKLGQNDGVRVGGAQRLQLLATGNNVEPSGDTADRTLVVELEVDDPNPRARPVCTFVCGDALEYARSHRRELLGAALTAVRGWIQAGCPCPPGESWGSFDGWTRVVVGLVRWLFELDPLAGRGRAATADPESNTLAGLFVAWEQVFGPAHVTTGRILKEVDDRGPDGQRRPLTPTQEALRESLAHVAGANALPGSKALGHRLGGFVGRRVPLVTVGDETRIGWLEANVDAHSHQKTYRVQTQVRPSA